MNMNRNTGNTLLIIASVGLMISGLIFLLIAIFENTKDNLMLNMAFIAIILANLFNIIRNHNNGNNAQ